MSFTIDWAFFLEVTTSQKCEKLMEKIARSLELELTNAQTERYWKDSATFKVVARSSFSAAEPKDGFYEIMIRLNRLARTWLVGGPIANGQWSFSGTANKDSILLSGVTFIGFEAAARANDNGAPSEVLAGTTAAPRIA